jgi:3-oxoadipate enol-lactonase
MPRTASRPALNYRIEGRGPFLMLSHALGCDLRMWDGLAPALSDRYTLVRYDARCHGESDVIADPFSLDDMVEDAARLLDELRCHACSFVGVSLGGMIGQGLAIAHPERIRRLILANTASRYPEDARRHWTERARIARAEGMAGLVDIIINKYFSPAFLAERPQEAARFVQQVLQIDARGYAVCCEAIRSLDYYSQLDRVPCPTLVIAGGADAAAPPGVAEEIASRIPQSRFALIEGAGHLSVVERSEMFARLVRDFLQQSHPTGRDSPTSTTRN